MYLIILTRVSVQTHTHVRRVCIDAPYGRRGKDSFSPKALHEFFARIRVRVCVLIVWLFCLCCVCVCVCIVWSACSKVVIHESHCPLQNSCVLCVVCCVLCVVCCVCVLCVVCCVLCVVCCVLCVVCCVCVVCVCCVLCELEKERNEPENREWVKDQEREREITQLHESRERSREQRE